MASPLVERRREPRVVVPASAAHADRPLAVTVRVVDIALTGVLLASAVRLEVGRGGLLRMRLGDVPIEANVEIRRVEEPGGARREYRVGARFVAAGEPLRRAMKKFLNPGSR